MIDPEIKIDYSKKSNKFLDKNSHIIDRPKIEDLMRKTYNKLYKKEPVNLNIVRMKNYATPHFRIRVGDIRILFTIENGEIVIVDIKDIDYRGSIYKK